MHASLRLASGQASRIPAVCRKEVSNLNLENLVTMNILVVSDRVEEVSWIQQAIGQCRLATVLGFEHPAAALDWSFENEPDLVLVSHLMRATDGLEFIRRFRQIPGRDDNPVVLMHDHSARFLRGDALRIGATDFLEQPVDLPELVARVVNLLSLRHAQAELKSLRAGPANLAPEYRDTAKAMLH